VNGEQFTSDKKAIVLFSQSRDDEFMQPVSAGTDVTGRADVSGAVVARTALNVMGRARGLKAIINGI